MNRYRLRRHRAQFAHRDPRADPDFTRDAILEDTDVAIIGGGISGLLTAVRLKQAGITNIRVIDRAGDFGGTWYWSRYPGAACDVESYIYMPLLEETGYIPTEKYAKAPEIFEHCQRIATQLDPAINMWETSAPYVRSWIRDELGPEAAIADRLREDGATLLRIPELVRRIEAQFPSRGGAPEPPPLPHVELVWERRARQGSGWFGYVRAALLGGALVWGLGWSGLLG